MNVNFRHFAILSALAFFALGLAWMLAPSFFPSTRGVEFSYPVGLAGPRGAALYIGIGVMFFSARNTEPSSARAAVVKGFIVACLTLASLGVFELITGHARSGIRAAVLIEAALALAFACAARIGDASHETGTLSS
ncbi:hypothetical protein [Pandoraea sp. XY-2]|uniref:hypothetical protein n=1 Tax=Pandoraea sp. XY-2 TaxID=2518599 RepID=UPI00101B0F82|nr:hypothetical protein [Pandoraea sp. XY-2]QBC30651.1 hypothetical protein DRB87_03760 [Pandoraea sp. XY-2]